MLAMPASSYVPEPSSLFPSALAVLSSTELRGRICREDCRWEGEGAGLQEQLVEHEVSIMRELSHTNIVKVLRSFTEPDAFYTVMELCKGGDLYDYVVSKVREGGRRGGLTG